MVELDITKDSNDDNNDDRPVLGMCLVLSVIGIITIACLVTIYLMK